MKSSARGPFKPHLDPFRATLLRATLLRGTLLRGTLLRGTLFRAALSLGAVFLGLFATGSMTGCGGGAVQVETRGTMNTDLTELKRLIKLPADVNACEWQTGTFAPSGGDWWLAAVLDVGADRVPTFLAGEATRELVETPPGLKLDSAFASLRSLPDAQVDGAERVSLVTETYSVAPYASSPLLGGKAIRLSAHQVLVLLWTL